MSKLRPPGPGGWGAPASCAPMTAQPGPCVGEERGVYGAPHFSFLAFPAVLHAVWVCWKQRGKWGVLGVPGERETLTPRRPHKPKKARQEVRRCGGHEIWEGGISSPHISFSCYFLGKVSLGPGAIQSAP